MSWSTQDYANGDVKWAGRHSPLAAIKWA